VRILGGSGVFPIYGYTGRLWPKVVTFISSQYTKGYEKIVVLVCDKVTKSTEKWKRWWLKE